MYWTQLNQSGNNKENVTSAFIQEDGNSTAISSKDMLPSADIHFQDGRRQILVTSPMLQEKFESSLSSSQPKNKAQTCRLSINTSKYPVPRRVLYKSQSFTIGQNSNELHYLRPSNEANTSFGFSDFPACNMNLSSSQKQQRDNTSAHSSPISLKQASCLQLPESNKRFSKHKSVNIPVRHGGSDVLSPAMLVKDLERSTILHLTTTPDSGFCTPSSSITNETFSVSSMPSTPKSSRTSTTGVDNPGAFWKKLTSGDSMKSLTTSPSNQSFKSVDESYCSNQAVQSEPQTATNLVMPPSVITPQLTLTPVASGDQQSTSASGNLQILKVLQELDNNKCYETKLLEVVPQKPQYERPNYSYMDLIKMALKQSEDGEMTLREILSWIEDQFPYFKYKAKQSWKSSIRCNLSVHSDFTKVEGKKHGAKWKIADGAKSYLHRLPKLPVIKHPIGPKVPAVTRLKTRRSGPLPILPKSAPYALVPLSLAALEQGNQSQRLQQQTHQIFQQQQMVIHVPLQHLQQHQQALQVSLQQQQQALQVSLQQQQSFNKQVQGKNVKINQPSLTSPLSRAQQAKPGLLHIAPKMQQLPTAIIWDPQTFRIFNQSDSLSSNDSLSFPSNSESSQNVNLSLSDTPRTHKIRTLLRSDTSDHALQPLTTHIHQGGLVNEKKIVFYYKQEQDQQQVLSEVSASVPTRSSCPLAPKDKIISRARSICKTVDKIKGSKSFDTGNKNIHVRPYSRGKRESVSRDPGIKEENICIENKDPPGKIPLKDDDDKRSVVNSSPGTPVRSLTAWSGSAPIKCLIKQAWDQAGAFSESQARDFDLGSQVPGTSKEPDNYPDGLGKTGHVSLVLSNRTSTSTIYRNKENQNITVSDVLSCSTYDTDGALIHTTEIPENGDSVNKCGVKSSGQVKSRGESITNKIFKNGEDNMNKEKQATLNKSKVTSESGSNPPPYQLQEVCQNTFLPRDIASKTMSASKIVFHGSSAFLNSSSPNSNFALSPAKFMSSSNVSLPEYGISSSQTTPQCPQPRFYRTRSRRKQIHTPLTTDISPDKISNLSESKTTVDVNSNQSVPSSSNDITNTISGNTKEVVMSDCFTPPSGTDPTSHTTSSPNSDKPSLDFALFLSKFSNSPHKNLCDASHEISSPPSHSLIVALPSSCNNYSHQSPFLSSSLTSSTSLTHPTRRGVGLNLQDSTKLSSHEIFRLSPLLSSTSQSETVTLTSGHVTSDPNFYRCGVNFLTSSPPLITNENTTLATYGQTSDNFLSLTSTPPAGNQPFCTSTPTRGMQLPLEILQARANSSGFLDSSLFDNLDSLMQNSLYELKTP